MKYVFHYDKEHPTPLEDYHESLVRYDGQICDAEIDNDDVLVEAFFEDGSNLEVYTYELEEVKEEIENEQ